MNQCLVSRWNIIVAIKLTKNFFFLLLSKLPIASECCLGKKPFHFMSTMRLWHKFWKMSNHSSGSRMWLIEPFAHQQTEGQMFHQPRYTIRHWPVATWRRVIHDKTLCSVCHKFRAARQYKNPGSAECRHYLFIQGDQALSHLCLLVHIFTSAPRGVIHQIKRLGLGQGQTLAIM